MLISEFDYQLDKSHIANEPADPRDSSKLLVLDRKTGQIQHKIFNQLPHILTANDILVFNETKVIPARIIGKKDTGGQVEVLLLKQTPQLRGGKVYWECLVKNLKASKKIYFPNNVIAEVLKKTDKIAVLKFNFSRVKMDDYMDKYGQMPLPPYIDSKPSKNLETTYNTVYATNRGSVAAPTAGLHFTDPLLDELKSLGVGFAKLTLHVGMGTFEPVQTEKLTDHKMHSEYYEISLSVAQYLSEQKRGGKRIIAVGTTTTRVLETVFSDLSTPLEMTKLSGDTSLFIYPPYKFKFVDGMITNFHLPKSTLLSLVSTFVDNKPFNKSLLKKTYLEAIKNNYRFYSFGDAMLII